MLGIDTMELGLQSEKVARQMVPEKAERHTENEQPFLLTTSPLGAQSLLERKRGNIDKGDLSDPHPVSC